MREGGSRVGARTRAAELPWAIAGVFLLAAAWVTFVHFRERPAEQQLVQFNVDFGPDAVAGPRTSVGISRDGRRIVFPTKSGLATRTLDQSTATPLSGTGNGSGNWNVTSGLGMVHPSTNCRGGGRSCGSPFGAPAFAQATMVSMSACVSERLRSDMSTANLRTARSRGSYPAFARAAASYANGATTPSSRRRRPNRRISSPRSCAATCPGSPTCAIRGGGMGCGAVPSHSRRWTVPSKVWFCAGHPSLRPFRNR